MNTAKFKHVAVILLFGYDWIFYEPCLFARKHSYYNVSLLLAKIFKQQRRDQYV
jgi:hypothetical protein